MFGNIVPRGLDGESDDRCACFVRGGCAADSGLESDMIFLPPIVCDKIFEGDDCVLGDGSFAVRCLETRIRVDSRIEMFQLSTDFECF
jgi:hypothetical protein